MNAPLISIITVCRNSEKTFKKTIESVLNQTYGNIEYIIIDGDSTDSTKEIIKNYEGKFNGRLKWISEKDNGIFDAMNKGIALATGEIIGIINSDDWYEHNTVKTVVNEYSKNGDGVYYGILRYVKDEKEVFLHRDDYTILSSAMIQHPTCFLLKRFYNEYGHFDTSYHFASDYDFMLRLYSHHVPFYPLDTIIANFSMNGVSNTQLFHASLETMKIQFKYGYRTFWNLIFSKIKLTIKHLLHLV